MDEKIKELKRLQSENRRYAEIVNNISKTHRRYKIPSNTSGNTIRFGVVSDVHIGSLYERTDALLEFYKLLKKEGIRTVLNAGDMLDGTRVYAGQEYEQYAFGFDRQLEALKERYPRIEGITTYFITGNHDYSFKIQGGINVGKIIAQQRKDLIFLNEDMANVIISKARYRLIHPSGGTAYAVSYKGQKIVESFSGGDKPHAVFIGHFHKADHMPVWRNVQTIQAGCFQSLTPFLMKKHSPAHVGGWIIEDVIAKNLTSRFKAEFVAFFEPKRLEEMV